MTEWQLNDDRRLRRDSAADHQCLVLFEAEKDLAARSLFLAMSNECAAAQFVDIFAI